MKKRWRSIKCNTTKTSSLTKPFPKFPMRGSWIIFRGAQGVEFVEEVIVAEEEVSKTRIWFVQRPA
jgi:hypothetical protein